MGLDMEEEGFGDSVLCINQPIHRALYCVGEMD